MHRPYHVIAALWLISIVLSGCSSDGSGRDVFAFVNGGGRDDTTPPEGQVVQRSVYTFVPETRPVTAENVAQLQTQPGFNISIWAQDLGNTRMLAAADDGTVYVTTPQQNRVLALRDLDNDGRADEMLIAADNLPMVHGITIHGDRVYLAAPTTVWIAQRRDDGSLAQIQPIIEDLPEAGQHPNRTLAIGPDNMLYITVGSTCNDCEEPNPEHATVLRAAANGSSRTIFARGLRNTIGIGWHPQTGEMWGMDHGTDERGNDYPPEELNRIEEGHHYGWPWVYGKQQVDPVTRPPTNMTKEQVAARSTPSVLEYQPHAAPIQMTFYTGDQFPERYRNGAFVAMRGSWNRYPAVGYKVVFIDFEEGEPIGFEDFVTGFLIEDGQAQFARLAGITAMPDGSLLVSDDQHGVIYRITYGEPAVGPQSAQRSE